MRIYKQTNDARSTCIKYGISRPTLRKWWKRYQAQGEDSEGKDIGVNTEPENGAESYIQYLLQIRDLRHGWVLKLAVSKGILLIEELLTFATKV